MMQDVILTMCKSSVKEFVDYVLAYCPEETKIVNTREVHNKFNKKMLTPEDSDYEEEPHQNIPPAEMDDH